MEQRDWAIQVQDLQKSYKGVAVLQGVSFRVPRGSVFALLGANGAGKTTTIQILTTLILADGGTAHVGGFDVATQAGQVRRSISVTGQSAAVDGLLTGRENLVLMGQLRHVADPAGVAMKLLGQFGLEAAADRRTQTYSGGMRRKLDIALSLIGSPDIIFFDEPTTGLDPAARASMWETIRELASSGTTIFLTTQYLEEADKLADTIAVLSKGKIAAMGTPTELKQALPRGAVELRFASMRQMKLAAKMLAGLKPVVDDESLTLTVATDGKVGSLRRVLELVDTAGVEVERLTQRQPSLDEAFMAITRDEKQKEGAVR